MDKGLHEHNEMEKFSDENSVVVANEAVDDIDPEEEKRLLRKIDLYLLPCIWIMYLLSYMDRTK